MSINPVEIPTGAVRYNTDTDRMEVYIGSTWMEVAVSSPNLDGGARGIFSQGTLNSPGGQTGVHDYINLSTTGNAIEFGDTNSIYAQGCCADRTRGLFAGGDAPSSQDIDFVTIASTGSYADSGSNLNGTQLYPEGLSNGTRGLFAGGFNPGYLNVIDHITIQSLGQNAADFGDLTNQIFGIAGCSNPTRGLYMGGAISGTENDAANQRVTIDFVTISSLGNAQDFGDLSERTAQAGAASNSTRGIMFGGRYSPTENKMQVVTIATLGNAVEFGSMTRSTTRDGGACSSSIRAAHAGGDKLYNGAASSTNQIDYVNIQSLGDGRDFGDLTVARRHNGAVSNGHGGL
jgi:hypothetical protein